MIDQFTPKETPTTPPPDVPWFSYRTLLIQKRSVADNYKVSDITEYVDIIHRKSVSVSKTMVIMVGQIERGHFFDQPICNGNILDKRDCGEANCLLSDFQIPQCVQIYYYF